MGRVEYTIHNGTSQCWTTNGESFEEVKNRFKSLQPAPVATAAAAFKDASEKLAAAANALINHGKVLRDNWGGEEAKKALAQLSKVHWTATELSNKSFKVAHSYNWYSTEILTFYKNLGETMSDGMFTTGGDHEYARERLAKFYQRTGEAQMVMPNSVSKDLPASDIGNQQPPPGGGRPPGGGPGGLPNGGGPGGGPGNPKFPDPNGPNYPNPNGPGGPNYPGPGDPNGPGNPNYPGGPNGPGGPNYPGGPNGPNYPGPGGGGFPGGGGGGGGDLANLPGGGGGGLPGGGGGLPGGGPGGIGGVPPGGAGAGGLGPGGIGGFGPGGLGAAGRGGLGGMPMMPGAGGGKDGEQDRERTTWLTEDEDVWGADGDTAPPVIG
ncbi:hypothetical protein [Thermomonospora umbrina]|uniref:PPE family protein n=1 Tax=Thermomonospora umbrina TaxID=111806 RepID=A0A3D9SKY6_9ACTN|nr:hypothetical protein [Thermomonospora umbrina]REE96579.1 hypothetical protein DFJ69_2018 [Thermomonospora umbrina]